MHTQPPPEKEASPRRPVRTRKPPIPARFRLHTEEHEPPSSNRIFGLTLWAAISIFIGLVPTGRLVVVLTLQIGVWWYPIATAAIGLLGLATITCAFASIHRTRLPWYLMSIATLLLTVNVAMVYMIPWK